MFENNIMKVCKKHGEPFQINHELRLTYYYKTLIDFLEISMLEYCVSLTVFFFTVSKNHFMGVGLKCSTYWYD